MIDRLHKLVSRASVAALVLGKGNSQVQLFYLHEKAITDEDIALAQLQGFTHRGLIGLVDGRLEMEHAHSQPREQTERLMRVARSEFLSALALMAAGGTVH